jgi:hypothetical protein
MKSLIAISLVGILVICGMGVVAYAEPKKSAEILKVKGGIGQVSITIENTGETSLDNLKCQVSVTGGFLNKIGVSETSILGKLEYQATEISETEDLIFGFGSIDITIDVDYADVWSGQGFIVGPIIFGIQEL